MSEALGVGRVLARRRGSAGVRGRRLDRIGLAFVAAGLALLLLGCGGGGENADSDDAQPVNQQDELVDGAIEDGVRSSLLRALPLDEDEANCLAEAFFAALPDINDPVVDPEGAADDILETVLGAQSDCLSVDRLLQLSELIDQSSAAGGDSTYDPAREAFLLAVGGIAGGLPGTEDDLVEAGHDACALAEAADGSLSDLVQQLSVTPGASALAAAKLAPLLGINLRQDELIVFATIAVVSFCPDYNDLT